MARKLLVLGLDAADPALLRRWVAEDKLPAIARLLGRGTSGAVQGVDGFYVGSTWPSFYTGLNPAGHGFYRIEQLDPGTYGFFRPLDSRSGVGGIPFWKVASDAGRRVAVLDVPLTRLDPSLNGVQIVEWGGHDSVFGFQASPPALRSEVLGAFGEYPLPSDCDARRRTAADFGEFVSSLELAVRKKTALTLELLDRDEWDLFVQVFTEAHCAGHQCWHLHDPKHPAHDEQLLATLSDPVERVYRAIDHAVGEIVERAGNMDVLLLSAHGMSAYRGADFLLPEILYRLGVTVRPQASPLRSVWNLFPGIAHRTLRSVRRRFPTRVSTGPTNVSEWAEVGASRCFPVPNGSPVSGIRLNVVGREPEGLLRPGAEANSFCKDLERDLLAITDGRTGAPLIAAVHRTDTLYTGARRDALPDLLVEWSDDVPTGTLEHAGGRGATVRAQSNAVGTVEGSNAYGRTGEHVPAGLFAWVGAQIPSREREDPVRLIDFHPTICSLLDLPTPNVDGEVIPDLVAGNC